MRRELNALEGPISKCEPYLRNCSSPSGGPQDQALKTKLKPSSVSNSLLYSVGYTWTHARVCKTTLVCLHQCRLLSGFSDSPSCAQYPHVPFPPGLTPCPLPPRLTLSHLPAHNSWAQALTEVPWAWCALPPSPASQGKEGGFGRTHSHGGPRAPCPGRQLVTGRGLCP